MPKDSASEYKLGKFMSDESKLLNFNQKRVSNIEKKRRNFERVFFQNFLGAYATIEQSGVIAPIEILDISKEGLLFKLSSGGRSSNLRVNDEISIRLYFTKDSYIPVILNIVRMNNVNEMGEISQEFGCKFDKSVPTFEALNNFINFIYSFAEHSSFDKGDQKVYFL